MTDGKTGLRQKNEANGRDKWAMLKELVEYADSKNCQYLGMAPVFTALWK